MKNKLNSLLDCPLFEKISFKELEYLFHCLTFNLKEYATGSYIFSEGDIIQSIGIIVSGKAHIIMDDFWGRRSIFAELKSGDVFGEVFAIKKLPLNVSVIALENSEVIFLNPDNILTQCDNCCSNHNQLIKNLLSLVASKNMILTEKTRIISERSTKNKLLAYFSLLSAKQNTDKITLPFNREQLADYLNVERSAMSYEMSKLKDKGYIDYYKNKVVLFDIDN